MGGGLLQLVAYGAQDVYLTGNPQITFFKVVYRRHTNFAIEAIEQTPTGSNSLGSRVSFQITRNGDLIHRVYFYGVITAPSSTTATDAVALVPNFGHKLLKTIELEIGGQRIDKHYSEWLYIWNELSLPIGKRNGYNVMVGANGRNIATKLVQGESYELYVPLEFWFCRNVGLALPLIALQYHEVKINIEYENETLMKDTGATNFTMEEELKTAGTTTANGSLSNNLTLKLEKATLWVDYIFLDTDERRRFAQLSHEYLIEQLQFTGADSITSSGESMKSIRMNFNHPCKELVWTVKDTTTGVYWNNYSSAGNGLHNNDHLDSTNPVTSAKIMLNGNDRFATRKGDYFSLVQPYQHHENTPDKFHQGINVYSFALKPEEHQPSGTLNMSRIDTAVLSLSSSITGVISIYAVNYNVLRILSGMGGLAYSN
uniref:Major capsid protein N-terminal domain-containing protein n=1 Tax=viral metagenome TaxID=1070528 RepID=A0A6C0LNV6_9ZZZZ